MVVLSVLNSYSQESEFQPVGDGEFEQRVLIEIEDRDITTPVSSIYWEIRCYIENYSVYVYANDSVERIIVNGISYTQKIYEMEYFFEGFIESIELPYWETGIIQLPTPTLGKQISITIERRKVQLPKN